MQTFFADLCAFFGVNAAPANLAELFPWLAQVLLSIGLFLFVFGMIRTFVLNFNRRW